MAVLVRAGHHGLCGERPEGPAAAVACSGLGWSVPGRDVPVLGVL